jgi:hypothetical protein
MILIRNSNGSVCCRTSDENNLCNRCRDKYREEDQEDMLMMPTMNYSSDKNPISYFGAGDVMPSAQTDHDDDILRTPLAGDIFELNRQQQQSQRQSSYVNNNFVDPDMLITPTLAY